MARVVKRIVIHCSAARPAGAKKQTAADIDRMHKARGWRKIGYHRFVMFDGTDERGRKDESIGSGVFGYNKDSIHICYAGGLDESGKAADTRSHAQKLTLARIVHEYTKKYPGAEVLGHRDLSPDKDGDGTVEKHEWLKECPCYDVRAWWAVEKNRCPL